MKRCLQQMDYDIQLMFCVKDSDHQAFNEIRRKYKATVRNFLVNRGCPESLLDDLKQEVFAGVWKNRKRYRGDSSVKTYLYRIAENALANELKHSSKRKLNGRDWLLHCNPGHSNGLSDPEANVYRVELTEAVHRALSRLPPAQRQAVVLRCCEGMSFKEGARHANCTVEAFRSLVRRAFEQLRQFLKDLKP